MKEWLRVSLGQPFATCSSTHSMSCTRPALYHQVAPQDAYKSPVTLREVIAGAFDFATPVGYNTNYIFS